MRTGLKQKPVGRIIILFPQELRKPGAYVGWAVTLHGQRMEKDEGPAFKMIYLQTTLDIKKIKTTLTILTLKPNSA